MAGKTSAAAPDEGGQEIPRIMTILDCPECQNRGFTLRTDEKGYRVAAECRCMARRRSLLRLERSGLQDMIERYTFEAFQTPERWQLEAKQMAQEYAEHPSGWFLAAGSVGAGKTHLCTAICARLIEAGFETRYMLWRDVAPRAKAAAGKDPDAYGAIMDPLKEVQVLYIDDLFKVGGGERPTTGDLNLGFELLNARYNDKTKQTIISTELSIAALMDLDEAEGSRIYERSRGHLLGFENKPNWRIGEIKRERKS